MIDAADPSRFEEAREELKFLLEDEGLQDVPFLILGNKADDPVRLFSFPLFSSCSL